MTTYKLLTIDVWDTLLRRHGHPDLAKLQLGQSIILENSDQLTAENQSPWNLLRLRQQIEAEHAQKAIAKGGDGEYKSDTILTELLYRASKPDSFLRYPTTDYVQSLLLREFNIEASISYPDPGIRDYLTQFSYERVIFLSDFYWPAERLQSLLDFHGFRDLVDAGISSCDVGLNKRSGRLYKYLHEREGISSDQHLHIGDNHEVDVLMAQYQHVVAYLYQPKSSHQRRLKYERSFHSRTQLLDDIQSELVFTNNAVFNLGLRCAPLFVGYSLFLAEQALRRSLDQLYFFTREGEFFLEVFQSLFQSNHLAQQKLPPVSLLEVSRLATFAASLETVNADSLMRLWRLYSTQSLGALLLSLGFHTDRIAELAEVYQFDHSRPIQYPWQDADVLALLANESFLELVNSHCQQRRRQLLAYLDGQGFVSNKRIGIVDIGWRGTIQDNLAHCLSDQQIQGFYLGLARFLNPQPKNTSKHAYGPDLNSSQDHAALLDAVSGLEMLCNSPNGSVESYLVEGLDICKVNKRIDPMENEVYYSFTQHFQAGVLEACGIWSQYIDHHVITSEDLRPLCLSIWHKLLHATPQELADAYAQLSHNEVFGVGGFVDKSAVPSISTVLLAPISRRRRNDLIAFVRLTQWPSVVMKRRDLRQPHKSLLVLTLLTGRIAKRTLLQLRRSNWLSPVR